MKSTHHPHDTGDGKLTIQLRDRFNQRFHESVLLSVVENLPVEAQSSLSAEVENLTTRLDSLVEASRNIHRTASLDSLLHRLITLVSAAFNADRSSLFLYDAETDELISRVAQGDQIREIRFPSSDGIAGWVFQNETGAIVANAYEDDRFNPSIDSQTGYVTRTVLCVPVRFPNGEAVGVMEVLNKTSGEFTVADQALLEAFASQTAFALEYAHLNERSIAGQHEQSRILEVSRAISSELGIDALLTRIISIASDLLDSERSTLFLHDPASNELWSRVAEGIGKRELRFPDSSGIAGEVFSKGLAINIPDAYADPRFNQAVDKETGFRTRSILTVPIVNKVGLNIGVMQVLNRRGGPFTLRDQRRLELLAAQSAIALDNARLFHDAVEARKYSDNVLTSLTNGVFTVDCHQQIVKANRAACDILGRTEALLTHSRTSDIFINENVWLVEAIDRVCCSNKSENLLDVELKKPDGTTCWANVNITSLTDSYDELLGTIVVLEDLSKEKRVRATMSRYLSAEVTDEVIKSDEAILGGRTQRASILFSDISGFTRISERLGAEQTVQLLNRYFSEMSDILESRAGVLDKYIGDGLMAVFGTPFEHDDDARNAVLAALDMHQRMDSFNNRQKESDAPPIHIRVGVNTDDVVVGNIGSPRRMDYTVIGDGVNTASRLENANKFFGTKLLVSESTVSEIGDEFIARELGIVRFAGKENSIRIFELLGEKRDLSMNKAYRLIRKYDLALAAFRDGRFEAAINTLEALQTDWPDDGPARALLRRSLELSKGPRDDPWDFATDFDTPDIQP